MEISFLEHQWEFLTAKDKYVLLSAGIGAGKSFVGSAWAYTQATTYPGTTGLIGANSYKQLRRSTIKAFTNLLDSLEVRYRWHKTNSEIMIGDTKIICATMSEYEDLRGIEISWFWLDECRDMQAEAFDVLMGRLREKSGPQVGRLTSSPKGFNWMYDYFYGELKTDDFRAIAASTQDNTHLPEGYAEALKEVYSQKFYEQEVLGKIVNIASGNIYYSFNRDENTSTVTKTPGHSILVGLDFNVNPMCGVIAHYINNTLYVFDEIYIESSNTHEVAQYIKRKYGIGHTIIPDATGKALKTSSAGLSDHQILEQAGFRIPKVRNPFRADRYNCVNLMLEKGQLVIDNKCKKLIRDIEQLTYKEGTDIPDTTRDKTLSHISDALGYLCWHVNPLINKKVRVNTYA